MSVPHSSTDATQEAIMNQTNTQAPPVIDYRGHSYTIEIRNDAEGYGYPLYHLGQETFISLQTLKREIDHRVNQAMLGRDDSEGLI